jgi:diadenosine tetraphosphate (Ap4A) HIT family hydrolase
MRPGHTLVVPREEIDHWVDMDPELADRLFSAAHAVGKAIDRAFQPRRVGVMIVGDEVPHVHVHVVPIDNAGQLSFASVDRNAKPDALDAAAERIRNELRAMGRAEVSD